MSQRNGMGVGRSSGKRQAVAVGLLAGAAVGAWAGSRVLPRTVQDTEPRALIDWDQARGIAITMNRGQALTASERQTLDQQYRDLVEQCVPLVADYTGDTLPDSRERTFAFDRVDWINANIDAFRTLFAPIESLYTDEGGEKSVAAVMLGGLNRRVISAELGLLLGYLARRVLGQYDLALLGREPITTGKLYYVEPNIRAVERNLNLPPDQFRMWLALHETTHAFEFESHPWVRAHFNSLLTQYMEFLKQDAEQLKHGVKGLKIFVQRARSRGTAGGSWIEAVMTPEQRQLFNQMQAMMCVIEGYSNHVMNIVGRDLLPSYDSIAEKFARRQRERTTSEQLFARLTGLDVKMEQYRLGEAFVNHVVEERGHAAIRQMWSGPEALPSMAEIREPARWLARMPAAALPSPV